MNTTNTSCVSENVICDLQQIGSVGSFPIFGFSWGAIPQRDDIFRKETGKLEIEKLNIPQDIDILELAKKFYLNHKEIFLKQYKGKYIAILNNKVIGSNKDFSRLAQRVYAKHGYQTIYMPFVDVKEKAKKVPSPRIERL